ncbi:MAG TPA: hypothetical protein VIQ97_04690, partial [Prevotella sp.]
MNRKCILTVLLGIVSVAVMAQNRLVTGTLIDRDTKEPMLQTTVQLLQTDSTFVTGGVSNEKGLF